MKQPEKHRIFCQNNRIREINFNLLSGLYPFGSLLFVLWISFSCQSDYVVQPVAIIPEPVSIDTTGAYPFVVDDHSIIYITDSSMYPPAELLLSSLDKDYDIEMVDSTLVNLSGISLLHATDSTLPDQGYTLEIQTQRILIRAHGAPGWWNGVQTLRQILPADPDEVNKSALPTLNIRDYPRFDWRGMHLDVSRHFMPVEFVKKYIDMLSYHKLNVFHWHLVDGVGWRIEIKSHPELTDLGAWRVEKDGKMPWEDFEIWREGDSRPRYGGYYTQEEIREVVEYASEKQITIIPEIELPGHSKVVLQCFPDLRCIDEEGTPLPNNGVYCANLKPSYDLLEDVLTEVMDMFPSEYIHIGGDEVNKENWKNCVRDKALMNQYNYSPEEVQSHFINHFDRFLRDHGRKLLGWHEILEGNLSSSAAIMYWGGPDGVENILRQGHQTVLTTGNRYYFDHYQSTSQHEPPAFGGLSTLTQVYEYDPVPPPLDDQFGNQVLGIQANLWTEYIPDPDHAEYMVFPRIAALAESAWTPREQKDLEKFKKKLSRILDYYDYHDINYARSVFRPMIEVTHQPDSIGLLVSLQPEIPVELYYTTDGTDPNPDSGNPYTGPFRVTETTTIRASAWQNGEELVLPETKKVIVHQALGKEVTLGTRPYGRYSAEGGSTLVDGRFGGNNWGNGRWLGLLNKPLEAIIDLAPDSLIQSVGFSSIEDQGSGIYFPDQIRLSISENGRSFNEIAFDDIFNQEIRYDSKTKDSTFTITFPPKKTRFLKVEAIPPDIPDQGVFIFVDEIIVED